MTFDFITVKECVYFLGNQNRCFKVWLKNMFTVSLYSQLYNSITRISATSKHIMLIDIFIFKLLIKFACMLLWRKTDIKFTYKIKDVSLKSPYVFNGY